VRRGVQAAVSLRVAETRVRAVLEEQVHDVGQALSRGPLERRCVERAGYRIEVRAVRDEVFAGLGFATHGGPVQRCDVVFVAVGRACTTGLDQPSDVVGIS